MKQWQVLKTVFPEVITDNFEFTGYEESADRLDYWLDERGYMSREVHIRLRAERGRQPPDSRVRGFFKRYGLRRRQRAYAP